MYIEYEGVKYPCQCRPSASMVYRGLPKDFPFPVSGEITLFADDGFVLRRDVVENYRQQSLSASGVLTLTNEIPAEPAKPVELTPAEKREKAYNSLAIVDWDGEMLTVTHAAQKWQYYAAEGSEKAEALQARIAEAKAVIRANYPDEEVGDDA